MPIVKKPLALNEDGKFVECENPKTFFYTRSLKTDPNPVNLVINDCRFTSEEAFEKCLNLWNLMSKDYEFYVTEIP